MRSLLCFEWYCHGRINEVAEHLHSNKFDAYFGNGIRCLNLFKNAIRLLKRFLPDNSILERRPSSDHTSLRAWLHNLGRLSATIEGRSLAFCEQHKKPSNNQVRQRKLQPFFEGIYKRLNELSFDPRVQFPTPVGVVDHCIPNEMNSTV